MGGRGYLKSGGSGFRFLFAVGIICDNLRNLREKLINYPADLADLRRK
jgi:hypothetical protein